MLNRLLHRTPSVPEMTVSALSDDITAGNDIQIIDVREADEWRTGHIRQARHIPLGELGQRASEIDPSRPVVFVCRSGNRSEYATQALRQAGYDQAVNLTGGMLAWQRAGLPIGRN
jgi:rhodanese-related sulfurtransferase